ncbi:hypothetical protein VAWG002_42140 (plasmid) [Aeromonas veronii]|nr:hypothetical protein VAWG002_42140 [Aeromonas veronii]
MELFAANEGHISELATLESPLHDIHAAGGYGADLPLETRKSIVGADALGEDLQNVMSDLY